MAHILKQRYLILSKLGQGGMGAVYKAVDTSLGNRLVAIKEMSQHGLNPQEIIFASQAFKQEAHMLAGLHHPHLPSVHEHFEEVGNWYLVMEFLEGETLEKYRKAQGGKLSVEEVLDVGTQLCTVLEYLHMRQPPIVFRDLKPLNIMRTSDGHLYLIDFGIARHFKVGQAGDTLIAYSRGYAAPEQYGQAQTTPQSDIFSLGAILHSLLSGKDPSQSPFVFVPLLNSDIPNELGKLIMQMVQIEMNKRPSSIAEVKNALQTLQESKKRWLNEGMAHYDAEHYQEALAAFEHAIEFAPKDAIVYYYKGNALRNLKRYEEALTTLDYAICLDPNDPSSYWSKGSALLFLNRLNDALAAVNQCISLDPNDANAFVLQGAILYELKRYEEALAAFDQAIHLSPEENPTYHNKGMALHTLQRYEEALVAFDRAILLFPDFADCYYRKGLSLRELKRYKEALVAFDRAILLFPDFAAAYYNKGVVFDLLRRPKEAQQAYTKARQLGYKA